MKTEVLRPARPWLALCLFAITAACLSPVVALAAPASIEGEYQCDDCHGYLKIHKQRSGVYKVWLGSRAEAAVERSWPTVRCATRAGRSPLPTP
jgi:hypothetical protein